MYFTKKEKITIAIIVLSIAILSVIKIFNPSSSDKDLVRNEELVYNEESEEINEIKLDSLVEETENIIIHLAGAVENPGVIELESGSRVIDAIELSGGLKEDACLDSINLARKLNDEEKLYIPIFGEEVEEISNVTEVKKDTSPMVNINNCTKEELMTLPGIGDKTADKIINYREESLFKINEDLMNVPGIGEKKYEAVKDLIKTN